MMAVLADLLGLTVLAGGVVFVLGAIIGSFLNVVIVRLPVHLGCLDCSIAPFFKARSQCPDCQGKIAFVDNIPLVSFFLLRGRCRYCQSTISWRYPLVELITALATVLVTARWIGRSDWSVTLLLNLSLSLLLSYLLIAIAVIDLRMQLIFDELVLPFVWLGLFINIFEVYTPLNQAVLGAVLGYGTLWLTNACYRFARGQNGIGRGDFKLLAMLGAWLGWQVLPFVILLASLLGVIFGALILSLSRKPRNTPLAFAPYLAFAGWVALVWGDKLRIIYFGN